VLGVIAQSRDPESFIAGGLPLNRTGPRISDDIDIFHDREEAVARAAARDAELLADAGYAVEWLRREPGIYSAQISRTGETTRLEWVVDSDFRYFPAVRDPEFGYVLHPVDLAVNKIMAAASRREPRDIVDLVRLHQEHLPLGAIAWAAVTVAPGFTPEGLLAEIGRNSRYATDDFRRLRSDPEIDAARVMRVLKSALDEAASFVSKMPTDEAGTIYLGDGKPVMPDPESLLDYVRHKPRRRGHWPTAPEITSAMLDRLQRPAP
jgi:hypothetical protein